MCRYVSKRITDGTETDRELECTTEALLSSACATPLSIKTNARRTAVTLIGSKVAFSTSTGACITEGRLAGDTGFGADPSDGLGGRFNRGRGRKPFLSRLSIGMLRFVFPELGPIRFDRALSGTTLTGMIQSHWAWAIAFSRSGTTLDARTA